MVWARRALASFLTLVLFLSLIGTALSTSANLAFAHPQKVETWLNQSNLYQNFLANAVQQAKVSAGSTEAQGSVTLSDSAVQQAASSAFTNQQFQQSLNTFLNSNYAWLEGKTATPSFVINLSGNKQNFANQIGQYVQDHINSLPVCSAQQLAEIGNANNIDPLNVTCRPPTLDPKTEANLVAQKVDASGGFLSNPVITANNINPKGSQAEPYYQKFADAPKLYKAAVRLPWIYAGVAILSAVAIIFVSLRRRNGFHTVAGTLFTSGVILVIIKFLSDTIFNHLEKHIFNQSSVGPLQQSLTQFLSKVQHQTTEVDFWFGASYIVLAVIIFIALIATAHRKKGPSAPPKDTSTTDIPSEDPQPQPSNPSAIHQAWPLLCSLRAARVGQSIL